MSMNIISKNLNLFLTQMNKIIENPLISVLLSVYNDDKNIKNQLIVFFHKAIRILSY